MGAAAIALNAIDSSCSKRSGALFSMLSPPRIDCQDLWWSAWGVVRTGLATSGPELVDDGFGRRRATITGLAQASRDCGVQRLAFAVVEVVASSSRTRLTTSRREALSAGPR